MAPTHSKSATPTTVIATKLILKKNMSYSSFAL